MSLFLDKTLGSSIRRIREKTYKIKQLKDLRLFFKDDSYKNEESFSFKELNALESSIVDLTQRLYSIGVDKEVLEFEVSLLEKFVITSDVIKDWRDHVFYLLSEINKIVEVYNIFTLFLVNRNNYEAEVFWLNEPSDVLKNTITNLIRKEISKREWINNILDIQIKHNVLDITACSLSSEKEITLKTKQLLLEKPKVGGIVGIGVQTADANDSAKILVIESVLTTLLNVVGSVKAIYKYTKEIEYYATRDTLTDSYNQRMFWEFLNYEIERAHRHGYEFSLLLIDIDNFKYVNDKYGHNFGDEFIKEISAIIKNSLREGDILSRYGGDEFCVILPETGAEQTYLVGKRIKDNIDNFYLKAPDGSNVKTSVSIGIGVYPLHATTAKDLFVIADTIMYKAKKFGKDLIWLPSEEDILEIYKEESEKSEIVIKALEKKALIPYFQPIVSLKTMEIEAYELLMRIDL